MKFFLIFITSCLTISTIFAQQQFSVGAIFESDQDEAEIAFRAAIERANIYERKFELVPVVVYANADDSFVIEKTVCNLISEGVIAIFGPNTASSSDIVASICAKLEIPHIIYDWIPKQSTEDRADSTMTLNLYPGSLMLASGYADIVKDTSWRSFTVVYETEKELQQLQYVLQITEPSSTPTTLRQLDEGPDYRPFLKDIKLSIDNCIVLHCSLDKIPDILRQANELKMLGTYQSIFIPDLDTHTLDWQEFASLGANITTVRLMDPTDFQVKNVAHDWEERKKREGHYYPVSPDKIKTNMILANDAVMMFAKGLAELDVVEELTPPKIECRRNRPWQYGRRIIEFLRARSMESATGRIDFNELGERSYFTLRLMEFAPTGFVDLATWDPVNTLDLLYDEEEGDQRIAQKFANKTVIITSRIGAPFLTKRVAKEGEILEGNARYEGYSLDLIDEICKLLNYKYEFQIAPDNGYGSQDKKTKEWDGLIKQLLDGNADLGICDLTMTSARRQAVDFTPPFMTLGISILYAKPEAPPTDLFSFLSPFSLQVWTYTAAAYLGVSLLIYGLSRMAPDDWENPHPCKEPVELENIWVLMNTTWLAMGSLMGQGCDLLPKAASTRILTGMWWFFALMMLNSYTANLAAFLTMSRMGSTIESAEDLAAQTKIKYGAVKNGSTMNFFRDSNHSVYQRMWTAMYEARPSVFTKTNDQGHERVCKEKGGFAFLMESTVLEYIIERDCDVMQVGGWLDYKTYGIAMPFNSPYRKQVSGAVLRLGELGTLAELKRKWWKEMYNEKKCGQKASVGGDALELELENVGGVFLVLGMGLLFSIFIGLLEFLWNIKAVAIEEKISLKEAFKLEALFALKFWITTKPVGAGSSKSSGSSTSTSSSSSASRSSNLRTKRSSKKLTSTSRSHSPKSVKSLAISKTDHLSVHEKLRKLSSMVSLKSIRSEQQKQQQQQHERDDVVEMDIPGILVKNEHVQHTPQGKDTLNKKEQHSQEQHPNNQRQRHNQQRQQPHGSNDRRQSKLSAYYSGGPEPFA